MRGPGAAARTWLRGVVLEADWGVSFTHRRPVNAVIAERIGPTLLLTGSALMIQFVLGMVLGVWAARRPGSARDHLIRLGAVLFYSLPSTLSAGYARAFEDGVDPRNEWIVSLKILR